MSWLIQILWYLNKLDYLRTDQFRRGSHADQLLADHLLTARVTGHESIDYNKQKNYLELYQITSYGYGLASLLAIYYCDIIVYIDMNPKFIDS